MKIFGLLIKIHALVNAGHLIQHSSTPGEVKDPVCSLQHSVDGYGDLACRAYIESYSYKADTNECVKFIYGGCGGNDNRFFFKEDCEEKCKL